MKKLRVFLIFALVLLSLFLFASCDGTVSNPDFQLTLTADNSGYVVAKYKGNATQVVIPSTHNGKPVKSIGGYAFSGREYITSVTIPSTVTSIDMFAFNGCENLNAVYIDDLSAWCNISFRDGASNPLYYAKELYLNGKLIEWLIIPEGVKSIKDFAFYNCESISILSIPQGVTSIGRDAFDGCKNLEGAALPDSLTSIGEGAFAGCASLASLTIPNGVQVIGDKALKGCTNLVSAVLGKGVAIIGENAFSGCPSLIQIAVNEDNAAYKSLDGSLYTKDGLVLVQYATGKSNSLFTLSKDVANIAKGALSGCANIVSFDVEEENARYKAIDGNLYAKDGSTLVQYAIGKEAAHFTIPQGVKNISEDAFNGCLSLTGVTIAESVANIGAGAFDNCPELFFEESGNCLYLDNWLIKAKDVLMKETQIKNDTAGIADGAFAGCAALESIYLPNSVKNIGEGAFAGCSRLTNMVLPFVGASASADANSPQTLFGYIFGTIYYEGGAATMQYHDLTSSSPYKTYYIPFSLRSVIITGGNILDRAFSNCSRLSAIIIQDTSRIGEGAFQGCSGLASITIPDTVTDVGKGAFAGCTSLESIILPFLGASKNAENAFLGYLFGASSYQNNIDIPSSLKTVVVTASANIAYFAFYNCGGLTQIAIGNGTVSIGERAFSGCAKLTAINIPQSVERIGSKAFDGCDKLKYEEEGGCLYLGSWLIRAKNASVASVTVRSGTSGIYDFAFNHCTQLTNITIGSGVVSIGESAFNGCSALTAVSIPNNVKNMGSRAFYGCTSLISVVMPESITQIKEETFYNCTSLSSVVMGKNIADIGKRAFSYCISLQSVTIPNSVINIGDFAFEDCAEMVSITIGNNVEVIGEYAFSGCSALANITIPNGVKSLGSRAFYGCTGLTSVTMGSSIETIGDFAFYGCLEIISLNIPNSVTDIGNYAFSGCIGLTDIIMPNNVAAIKDTSFSGCKNIVFFCEAAAKPQGWDTSWHNNRPVYWAGEWSLIDGVPAPVEP